MDWRLYAIYRLEHWGLSSINNSDVNDTEILEANKIYGSLGELAVMVMPQAQLNTVRTFFLNKTKNLHMYNYLNRRYSVYKPNILNALLCSKIEK